MIDSRKVATRILIGLKLVRLAAVSLARAQAPAAPPRTKIFTDKFENFLQPSQSRTSCIFLIPISSEGFTLLKLLHLQIQIQTHILIIVADESVGSSSGLRGFFLTDQWARGFVSFILTIDSIP